jgi:two-component system chemotaxis response regulator CheY
MGAGTVLVVDDDDDLRETVEVLLRAHGYRVATAASGLEALEWLRERAADTCVVLLDLMMPGMDGFTLRSTMSADPLLSPIPVVVVTGAGVLARQRGAELRAEVLHKPLDLSVLLGAIRKHCQEARP